MLGALLANIPEADACEEFILLESGGFLLLENGDKLLIENPICSADSTPAGRPRPQYDKNLDGKYIWVDGEYINVELEKPKKEVVKKVLKALRKVKSQPLTVDKPVEQILRTITNYQASTSLMGKAQFLQAYAEAIAVLQEEMQRKEEEELVTLLFLT